MKHLHPKPTIETAIQGLLLYLNQLSFPSNSPKQLKQRKEKKKKNPIENKTTTKILGTQVRLPKLASTYSKVWGQ